MTDPYTPAINTFIEQIKADKSIVQPWRNYALKHLQEALAEIRMGLTTSNAKPDEPADPIVQTFCTCPAGGRRRDCPAHGDGR